MLAGDVVVDAPRPVNGAANPAKTKLRVSNRKARIFDRTREVMEELCDTSPEGDREEPSDSSLGKNAPAPKPRRGESIGQNVRALARADDSPLPLRGCSGFCICHFLLKRQLCLPSLRDFSLSRSRPSDESLGYYRSSLRD